MANESILKEVWFLSSGTLRHLQEKYNPQKTSFSLSKLQKIKVWRANFKLKNLLIKVSQKQSIWVVIFKLDVKGQFKPKKRKSKFYFLKGAVHCAQEWFIHMLSYHLVVLFSIIESKLCLANFQDFIIQMDAIMPN